MSATFAFECFADQDVFRVLSEDLRLPLKKLHSFSQGEVINALRDGKASIGMVDEDPGKSHHAHRDTLQVVRTTEDLELRRGSGAHLILVKPALEECFLRSVRRLKLESDLPKNPSELRAALNRGRDHPRNRDFRRELGAMREETLRRGVPAFITGLEEMLRAVLPAGS